MLLTLDGWFERRDFPFHILRYPFRPDESIAPHAHEFVELVYVQKGRGLHTYRGQTYAIAEGDVFIIEPNAEHAYESPEQDFAVYNVLFHKPLLTAELEALSAFAPFVDFFYVEPFFRSYSDFQARLVLDVSDRVEMTMYLDKLLSEFTKRRIGYQIVVKTQLIELFIFLSRCYERQAERSPPRPNGDPDLFDHIVRFVDSHYAQPLTLEQISRLGGMSSTAFAVKFKQRTGKTFIEYRNRRRIDASLDLLARTDDKMIAIAEKVGFDDLSFFNKTFKQSMGCTPSEYRKNARSGR